MDDITHHTEAVRRLYKPDLPTFRDHLIRLDPRTRYNRFGLQVSDNYLTQYAELSFLPGGIAYGFFEDNVMRGAAELRVFASSVLPGHKDAEAAFSVERDWRRRGIGTQLMSYVVLASRNRSIDKLTVFCLRNNQPMVKLARKFEADLTFDLNDVTGRLVARPPSALSIWREMVDNTFDLGSAMFDYQARVIRAAAHHGR